MTRLRGWGSGGDRVLDFVPGGHWQTHTLIHAIALDGTRAAMILDGPSIQIVSVDSANACWLLL